MTGPPFDSRPETRLHIAQVQSFLLRAIVSLSERALRHDLSKLESPEVEAFDEWTPKLRALTYGSAEYFEVLEAMRPALDHHYAHNRHHPEHFDGGIREMSLLDLLEMLCDWLAATHRHADGDLRASIEYNQGRFGYPDELKEIFYRTLQDLL